MRVRFIINFTYSNPAISSEGLREEIDKQEGREKKGSYNIGEPGSNPSSSNTQEAIRKFQQEKISRKPAQAVHQQLQKSEEVDSTISNLMNKYKSEKSLRIENKFGDIYGKSFTGYQKGQVKRSGKYEGSKIISDDSDIQQQDECLSNSDCNLSKSIVLNDLQICQHYVIYQGTAYDKEDFQKKYGSKINKLNNCSSTRLSQKSLLQLQKHSSPKSSYQNNQTSLKFVKQQKSAITSSQNEEQKVEQQFKQPLPIKRTKSQGKNSQLLNFIMQNLDDLQQNQTQFMDEDIISQTTQQQKVKDSHLQNKFDSKELITDDDLIGTLLEGVSNFQSIRVNTSKNPVKNYDLKPLVEEQKQKYWDNKKKFFAASHGNTLSLNKNDHLVSHFTKLRDIYEILKDKGRHIAYRRAITFLKTFPQVIQRSQQVEKVTYLGKGIKKKCKQILATGKLKKLQFFQQDKKIKVLRQLAKVWGVGPTGSHKLYKLGFRSISQLRKNGDEHLNNQQKIGLKYYQEISQRIPRAECTEIYNRVKKYFQQMIPQGEKVLQVIAAGSYRRGRPTCGDLDILVTRKDDRPTEGMLKRVCEKLIQDQFVTDVLFMHRKSHYGSETFMGMCQLSPEHLHRRIDIKIYPREQYGFALLYFTGSDYFNRSMRLFARKKGLSLSDHGLVSAVRVNNSTVWEGQSVPAFREEDVFKALHLEYKEPGDRDF